MNEQNHFKNTILENEHGVALVLSLILLAVLMVAVLSFSRISVTKLKISNKGLGFRKTFVRDLGINVFYDHIYWDIPLNFTSGLFSNEHLTNGYNLQWPLNKCAVQITLASASIPKKKDIASLIQKRQIFVPGYQVNSGGGKGTQSYTPAPLHMNLSCNSTEDDTQLLFRNWMQRVIPK